MLPSLNPSFCGFPGSDPAGQAIHFCVPIYFGASVTPALNSATYIASTARTFYIDFSYVRWTHFGIHLYGLSNAAGQTVTLQLSEDIAGVYSTISKNGDDLVVPNTTAWYTTGWIPIFRNMNGFTRLALLVKGSNATVDLTYENISISLMKL
jgi:hypothetical protein